MAQWTKTSEIERMLQEDGSYGALGLLEEIRLCGLDFVADRLHAERRILEMTSDREREMPWFGASIVREGDVEAKQA